MFIVCLLSFCNRILRWIKIINNTISVIRECSNSCNLTNKLAVPYSMLLQWSRRLLTNARTSLLTAPKVNKLCGKPRNMPRPCNAARCSPAPAHTRLTPAAPSAPCSRNIRDRQAAARSGRWRRNWCRPYKLCSDLNRQPKRPGDLDLWPVDLESGVRVTCDVGYPCANFGHPRPLCSRLRPDVRDRQTDRQTDVSIA